MSFRTKTFTNKSYLLWIRYANHAILCVWSITACPSSQTPALSSALLQLFLDRSLFQGAFAAKKQFPCNQSGHNQTNGAEHENPKTKKKDVLILFFPIKDLSRFSYSEEDLASFNRRKIVFFVAVESINGPTLVGCILSWFPANSSSPTAVMKLPSLSISSVVWSPCWRTPRKNPKILSNNELLTVS